MIFLGILISLIFNFLPINQYINILSKLDRDIYLENVEEIETTKLKIGWYKWVGAVIGKDNNIYAIPTGAKGVLKIDTKTGKYRVFGKISGKAFKYTGGCLYKDGCIYGFPRASNNLLKIDTKNEKVEEIDLKTNYNEKVDHHYSGALYKDTIYLGPRNANHILAINLKDYSTNKIGEGKIPEGYEYSGAIRNYDGLIYFFPYKENSRVMVLNPETEEIEFIGNSIKKDESYCFGASIAPNGYIYGFTCYGKNGGILKINPKTKEVSKILEGKIEAGFFGTKMGVNGKLYSIPGISNRIYEFDPETETAKLVYEVNNLNDTDARCAGGMTDNNGNIWFIPAKGNRIYKLNFSKHFFNYRKNILQSPYFSNY